MNRDVIKFIQRLVKFTIPYLLIAAFTIVVFYQSGEIFWLNKTVASQIKERRNLIYGPAYSNIPQYYKFEAVDIIHPKVMALGSSRVLQFRSGFFKDSVSFYTVGGIFKRLGQLRAFLESLPDQDLPKSILLGIDQWWFNPAYDSTMKRADDLVYNQMDWNENWEGMQGWQNFYFDWWKGKITWKKLWIKEHDSAEWLGINARIAEQGFRKDGSYSNGKLLDDSLALSMRVNNAIESVKKNERQYGWISALDKNAMDELRLLLRFCKKNKITVTAFIPPVNKLVLDEMKKNPDRFPHFFKLNDFLYPVFREYGFYIYDFTESEKFGSNNSEMIDAVHGGEKLYLRIYLNMLRRDGYLNQYSDSVYLKLQLDSAKGNFNVFGNQ